MNRKVLHILFLALAACLFCPEWAQAAGKKFIVVIDAGHGGHDPGAVGKTAKEKTINLNTALALGRMIESNCPDVKVVYTRKTDVFIPLHQRAVIANNAKADLFISIHTNALPKGKITYGAETYTLGMARASQNLEVAKKENSVILMENGYKETYKGFNPNSSESYIIFEFMQDKNMNQSVNFAKKVQQQFKKAGRVDKGVHQAGFLVLRETAMPSVLVELGYISTPDEERFLSSSDGYNRMAKSIYNAFVNYRNTQSKQIAYNEPTVAEDIATPEPVVEEKIEQNTLHKEQRVERNTEEVTKQADTNQPIFKIQFLTSDRKLSSSDSRFKGLKNVDNYKEKGLYKYTYGATTDYNEILRKKKEINSKFSDCFIIAFRNGEKMDVNEAIRIFKRRK